MNQRSLLIGVVVVLTLLTAGIVWWWPARKPAPDGASTTADAAASAATNAVIVIQAGARTNRAGLDKTYISTHWRDWILSPARDPFLVARVETKIVNSNVTELSSFQLKAIWMQTGGRLAAIDSGIYTEGDRLADFRIVRIEPEAVVVHRPDLPPGADRITFTSYSPAAPKPTGNRTNLIEQFLGPEQEKLF